MKRRGRILLLFSALAAGTGVHCAGAGGGSSAPPPAVSVAITPTSAAVFLGATQQFTATVSNASNTAVTWQVNGIAGGNAQVGTISASGLYTAPRILPSPATVTITAVSQQDPARSASAQLTVQSDVSVALAPGAASIELGAGQQFTVTVSGSGSPDTGVSWSVNGISGGNAEVGTVTAGGAYTAPRILPAGAITVTATSVADPAKSASSSVTVTSNLTVAITSGPATVRNGETVQFTAEVTPAPDSDPDRGLNWSVRGDGCASDACGVIDSTGLYRAPAVAPSPPVVTVTAASVADPAKSAAVEVTIESGLVVFVTPESATVELEATLQFSSSVGGTTDQRVVWDVNGIVGGNATVGTVTNTLSDPGLYTAPVSLPSPAEVAVRATSQADTTKSASAAVTLVSNVSVLVSPSASTRAVNRRQTFSAEVSSTSNTGVEWRVNGIAGGNTTVGRICIFGLDPCQPTSEGATVDYQAPASVPSPAEVTVEAVSQADPSRAGAALVTVIAQVEVSVSPSSVTLPAGATQQFSATVLGTSNQQVAWSVAGAGCTGTDCGTVTAGGLYTAPAAPPSPATVTVTATSADDPTRSAAAEVAITTGPFVRTLRPSSLTAGAAGGLTLRLVGNNFVAGEAGAGSTIVFQGADKSTSCASVESGSECTATLDAADLADAGDKTVQVRNPDGELSNQVALVVVAAAATEAVIELTSASPQATERNLALVDASGAGSGAEPVRFGLLGPFDESSNTCSLVGTLVTLVRPAAGTQDFFICFTGAGLAASHSYRISGPEPNDISVGPAEDLGFGIIRLRLTLASTTQPGARTLFVETPAKDKAAASGAIEVK